MKKLALVLLVTLCLASVLTIGASAAVPEELLGWETQDGTVYHLSPFLTNLLDGFMSIIPGIQNFVEARLSAFALIIYAVLAGVLLLVATFGYRYLTLMRGILGAVAGLFVGYFGWRMLDSWASMPEGLKSFIGSYRIVSMLVMVLVLALLFALIAVLLRRIGTAVAVSVIATTCLLPCLRSSVVFFGLLAVLFVFAVFKSRASVILLTSFSAPTFLLYFFIGANGVYPINLTSYFSPVVDPILLLGIVIGTVCATIHFRVSRKVRA